MSNEHDNGNENMEYVGYIPEDDLYSGAERMSDDESMDDEIVFSDESMTCDLDEIRYGEVDFEPIKEEDIIMMQMIKTQDDDSHLPLAVKSCEALFPSKEFCEGDRSVRNILSWHGVDLEQDRLQQGKLYRFYSPQNGHAKLKRCISETNINLDPRPSLVCHYCANNFSVYSPRSLESIYEYLEDDFNTQMDKLSVIFESLHIDTPTASRRVQKSFNLKTWTGALYEEPSTSDDKPKLLPIEESSQFDEFCGSSTSPGKLFADWFTTDHVPEEKRRK